MRSEWRVVWKREGLGQKQAIRQTRAGAEAKVGHLRGDFQVSVDGGTGLADGTCWLEEKGVPPLEFVRIERRDVGEWELVGGESET